MKKFYNNFTKINTLEKEKQFSIFYSVTHSLAQTPLAASKTYRIAKRDIQHGRKCSMCGEFDVIAPFNIENLKITSIKKITMKN